MCCNYLIPTAWSMVLAKFVLWFCYSNDANTFGQGVLILLFVLSLKCTYISGSAAINLVMIANGEADVYPQVGIRCWDIVAGGLIVKEAGKSHPFLIGIITLETIWARVKALFLALFRRNIAGSTRWIGLWLHEQSRIGLCHPRISQGSHRFGTSLSRLQTRSRGKIHGVKRDFCQKV